MLRSIIDLVLTLFTVAIVARVILSWVVLMNRGRPNPVIANLASALDQITEPILGPIRRALPTMGTLDLSPMVALLLIWLIRVAVEQVL